MTRQYCWEISATKNTKIVKFLDKSKRELDAFWKIKVDSPLVFLLKSRNEIDKFWDRKTERWMSAWATGGNIFILHLDVYEKESDHKINHFWQTIKHEYCHLYYRALTGDSRPKWLNEGLACYMAGQIKKVPDDQLVVRLNDFYDKGGQDIYSLGYFWVKMLIERFGDAKLLKLIRGINAQMTKTQFAQHFKKIYGFGLTKAELKKLVEAETK